MLRYLVLALLTVNIAFLAWSQGWLHGDPDQQPDGQRDPQRLADQLHPEQIELLQHDERAQNHALRLRAVPALASAPASGSSASSEPSSAPDSAPASPEQTAQSTPGGICLEAGPFSPEDASQVDKALQPLLPEGGWTRQTIATSGQWMVYMGPYPDTEIYARKTIELKRIQGLNFDEVRSGAFNKGFSLGRFTNEADAQTQLSGLRQRGIRTARVVTLRPAGQVLYLRVNQASVATQVTLSGLKLPQGKAFTACRS